MFICPKVSKNIVKNMIKSVTKVVATVLAVGSISVAVAGHVPTAAIRIIRIIQVDNWLITL